jgi:plasmid stability protein
MAVNISIKSVPDELAQRLRERAARNHRSLQGELLAIIEQAVATPAVPQVPVTGSSMSSVQEFQVQGWKTIEQLIAERQATGWQPHPSLAQAPLAVDIIRADRDSR